MLPAELPQGERGPQALWVKHGTALTHASIYYIPIKNSVPGRLTSLVSPHMTLPGLTLPTNGVAATLPQRSSL